MNSSPSDPSSQLTQHALDTAELGCDPGELRNPQYSECQRSADVKSDDTTPSGQHPKAQSVLTATTSEEPSEMRRGSACGAPNAGKLKSSCGVELSPMREPKSKIRLGRESVVTSMGEDDIQALLDTGLWTP